MVSDHSANDVLEVPITYDPATVATASTFVDLRQ